MTMVVSEPAWEDYRRRIGSAVEAEVRDRFRQVAYDNHHLDHVLRVRANALDIGRKEDANLCILDLAALLHDIGRIGEGPGECHAVRSAQEAERMLTPFALPAATLDAILAAIRLHRFSTGIIPETLEGRILQDADRLDALGAIGILRTAIHDHDRPIYDLEDPFARQRSPGKKNMLDHFPDKLLKLVTGFHTASAREMGKARHAFMLGFLEQLRSEIEA